MKFIILALLVVFSLISCNTTLKEKPSAETAQKPFLNPGCYAYQENGDTIYMKIDQVGEKVTGTLDIAYAEKDANTGTFEAELKGETLFGMYTFNSEGKQSKREIAFLVKNNQLIEGYGVMKEDGITFDNKDSIFF